MRLALIPGQLAPVSILLYPIQARLLTFQDRRWRPPNAYARIVSIVRLDGEGFYHNPPGDEPQR
jgi:hypothetical protein